MEQLINALIIPLLTAFAGAFSGWFFGRRKQQAEAVASELETVEKAVAIWREIAQDLKKELAEQTEKIEAQSAKIVKLSEEVSTLRRDNARLLGEMKVIKKHQEEGL